LRHGILLEARGEKGLLLVSLLFYFLALLAKESAITLVGVLILTDLCSEWERWRERIKNAKTKQ